MDITRNGSQPSAKGPADYFTGQVRLDARFNRDESRVGGATVTFEPGARTAWHTHPLGQTLIVLSGAGFAQREGGPVEEILALVHVGVERRASQILRAVVQAHDVDRRRLSARRSVDDEHPARAKRREAGVERGGA